MKITSSYGVELRKQNIPIRQTLDIYRSAVGYLTEIYEQVWEELERIPETKKRFNEAEHLIHTTKKNQARFSFDLHFPKMPSYLRRAAIQHALGTVSSYKTRLSLWEKSGQTGGWPKLLTYAAFDYADRDMNPVLLLADGVIGTMMEPVELPEMKTEEEIAAIKEGKKKWACIGHELDYANRSWIQPGQWDTKKMQEWNERASEMYDSWEKDVMVEEYQVEDAELVLTAYGISARICKSVVDMLRKEGYKIGLIRPITVSPFPYASYDKINYDICKAVLDVEMSIPAQFVEDVEMGVKGRCAIETCLCSGGNIMSREAVIEAVKKILG